MNMTRSFSKTNLAATLVVLLAVSSGAARAQAPATQAGQGDNAWPTESAAALSFGVPGSGDAPQASATVSFVDPMAAVDGASSGKIRVAAADAPSTLSFADANATVDGSSPYGRAIATGAPSIRIAATEVAATVVREQ